MRQRDRVTAVRVVRQVSGMRLMRFFQRKGWSLAKVTGTHQIFTMSGRRELIVSLVHGIRPSNVELFSSLMNTAERRQADL
jgi:predicted RNA binding protein YcfA (HicA-like mRNA interferase family)